MQVKQSKKMYSISNMEGIFTDLTMWMNDILEEGKTESITRYELINFLNTKGRVPLGIMKNNKPPRTEQPKCVGRILKDFTQCKNDSEQGESCFCKIHNIRSPKYTMEDTLEDIESAVDEERRINKAKSKAKSKAKREAKKAKSASGSESDSSKASVKTSSSSKKTKVVRRRKKIARKAKKVVDDEEEDIDFGSDAEEVKVEDFSEIEFD